MISSPAFCCGNLIVKAQPSGVFLMPLPATHKTFTFWQIASKQYYTTGIDGQAGAIVQRHSQEKDVSVTMSVQSQTMTIGAVQQEPQFIALLLQILHTLICPVT
jgi:hypothetical protein